MKFAAKVMCNPNLATNVVIPRAVKAIPKINVNENTLCVSLVNEVINNAIPRIIAATERTMLIVSNTVWDAVKQPRTIMSIPKATMNEQMTYLSHLYFSKIEFIVFTPLFIIK